MDASPLNAAPALGERGPQARDVGRWAAWLAAALGLTLLSAWFAMFISAHELSLGLVIGGCLGLAMVFALAIARYDAAAGLGFLFIGVVYVEPAPPDAIFAVVIAVALVTGRFRIDRLPMSILALLGVFILLNIASAVEAVDPQRALVYLIITLYLAVFAVWLTGYLNSAKRARILVNAYLIGAVVAAAWASLALFVPVPLGDILTVGGERAKALFEDPNVYGPFLVPIALILIEELISPRLIRYRTATKLLLLFVLMIGLFLSYSRGAWGNFAVAITTMLGVLVLRRGGARRAFAVLIVLVLGGVAVGAVLAVTGSLGFLEERAKLQTYDTQRFAAQRQGIKFGDEHLLGIGPGQFEVRAPVPSHNLYVRSLSEQGYLGLFTVLSLVLTTLVLALSNAAMGRDTYGIGSAALLGAWVGILLESFVIDSNHWRHLWLVAALIWIGAQRRSEPTQRLSRAPSEARARPA
jgi:O-antigen ligase